jgi:hypothetical protein
MNMEAQLPRRLAAIVASLRQLWARESLPCAPPPRVPGTSAGGRAFLQTLLSRETLPEVAPGAAAPLRPSFFRSLLVRDSLPPPALSDRPQNVRAGLRTLLARDELAAAPAEVEDRRASFLRFLGGRERLPAGDATLPQPTRNVSPE